MFILGISLIIVSIIAIIACAWLWVVLSQPAQIPELHSKVYDNIARLNDIMGEFDDQVLELVQKITAPNTTNLFTPDQVFMLEVHLGNINRLMMKKTEVMESMFLVVGFSVDERA